MLFSIFPIKFIKKNNILTKSLMSITSGKFILDYLYNFVCVHNVLPNNVS